MTLELLTLGRWPASNTRALVWGYTGSSARPESVNNICCDEQRVCGTNLSAHLQYR